MKTRDGKSPYLMFLILWSIIAVAACSKMGPTQAPAAPISLAHLFAHCNVQLPCDQAPPCLGETIVIEGLVDQKTIFNRRVYPQLPYEKFLLTDTQGGSIEIWAQSRNNQPIFDKLAHRPDNRITVTGRLTAIKLPIGDRCHWGLKIVIHEPSQIQYQ